MKERFLQCSAQRTRCEKSYDGIRRVSLKLCLDCRMSLITDKPFAHLPTKKVKYPTDKDNCYQELWKRTLPIK